MTLGLSNETLFNSSAAGALTFAYFASIADQGDAVSIAAAAIIATGGVITRLAISALSPIVWTIPAGIIVGGIGLPAFIISTQLSVFREPNMSSQEIYHDWCEHLNEYIKVGVVAGLALALVGPVLSATGSGVSRLFYVIKG